MIDKQLNNIFIIQPSQSHNVYITLPGFQDLTSSSGVNKIYKLSSLFTVSLIHLGSFNSYILYTPNHDG